MRRERERENCSRRIATKSFFCSSCSPSLLACCARVECWLARFRATECLIESLIHVVCREGRAIEARFEEKEVLDLIPLTKATSSSSFLFNLNDSNNKNDGKTMSSCPLAKHCERNEISKIEAVLFDLDDTLYRIEEIPQRVRENIEGKKREEFFFLFIFNFLSFAFFFRSHVFVKILLFLFSLQLSWSTG